MWRHSRDYPSVLVVDGTTPSAVTGTISDVILEEATGVEVYHATSVHDGTTFQLLLFMPQRSNNTHAASGYRRDRVWGVVSPEQRTTRVGAKNAFPGSTSRSGLCSCSTCSIWVDTNTPLQKVCYSAYVILPWTSTSTHMFAVDDRLTGRSTPKIVHSCKLEDIHAARFHVNYYSGPKGPRSFLVMVGE